MAGLNINFGTSVLKREARGIEEVSQRLIDSGWEKTSEVLGGRIQYFKSAGIGITAVEGPAGTIVLPSGPIRGQVFSGSTVGVDKVSVMGMGEKSSEGKSRTERKRSSDTTNHI